MKVTRDYLRTIIKEEIAKEQLEEGVLQRIAASLSGNIEKIKGSLAQKASEKIGSYAQVSGDIKQKTEEKIRAKKLLEIMQPFFSMIKDLEQVFSGQPEYYKDMEPFMANILRITFRKFIDADIADEEIKKQLEYLEKHFPSPYRMKEASPIQQITRPIKQLSSTNPAPLAVTPPMPNNPRRDKIVQMLKAKKG